MSRIGFILKPDKTEAGVLLEALVPWLLDQGHTPIVITEDQIAPLGVEVVPEDEIGATIDLAVVLGGDGTILRAARLVSEHGKPVLGINLGQLGFLVGFEPARAGEAILDALAGKLPREDRMRIQATFKRPGASPVVKFALNDVVLHQGSMARMIEICAFVDGAFVADYRADGLIVSTPTGSTAYSMAAGGPIVVPGIAAMTITPICAHALTHRPLVLDERSTIELGLAGSDHAGARAPARIDRGVILTVDGQWGHSFLPGDSVALTIAPKPLVIFSAGKSFFDVMRDKLHWGVRGNR